MSKSRRYAALAILLLLILSFAIWRISRSECFQLVGDVTCRIDTNQKIVALSFDDGPTPEGVDAVLAELEKRNIKATFFLIGKDVAKWPQQAERLARAGHELGNHSYSHQRMIGSTQSHYAEELAKTDKLLRRASGRQIEYFRPPFGKRLIGLPWEVEKAGYHLVTWDVADNVADHPTPQSYARDIIARTKPGSIILIHPMYRNNQVERNALPLVLDGLVAKGYTIVPVGKLLESVDH